jgi:hypothetical protein
MGIKWGHHQQLIFFQKAYESVRIEFFCSISIDFGVVITVWFN